MPATGYANGGSPLAFPQGSRRFDFSSPTGDATLTQRCLTAGASTDFSLSAEKKEGKMIFSLLTLYSWLSTQHCI
jgi:hypothetical protein